MRSAHPVAVLKFKTANRYTVSELLTVGESWFKLITTSKSSDDIVGNTFVTPNCCFGVTSVCLSDSLTWKSFGSNIVQKLRLTAIESAVVKIVGGKSMIEMMLPEGTAVGAMDGTDVGSGWSVGPLVGGTVGDTDMQISS